MSAWSNFRLISLFVAFSYSSTFQFTAFRVVRQQIRMVEGHSVHRVSSLHRQRLVGKKFTATSPNGRFAEGARAIDGKTFSKIEAVGKNLFAFFGNKEDEDQVVVHIHFGMAGVWAVYLNDEEPPEPTKTNRPRLTCPGIVADLSAMTVQHGTLELWREKRSKLGEDPLRADADPDALFQRVKTSKKSIGALIMDQSYFTGPGNIYRAEILFKAGVHPDRKGMELTKSEFDGVWFHTVQLLKRGYETGSILTVDPDEARAIGKPNLRRYIYNSSHCPRCKNAIKTWQIASRKCYACVKCQPLVTNTPKSESSTVVTPAPKDCVPFNSHCARESVERRLNESGPSRLTVKEIKSQLTTMGVEIPSKALKADLVDILRKYREEDKKPDFASSEPPTVMTPAPKDCVSFNSHCARESGERRLNESGPSQIIVKEIKVQLTIMGVKIPSKALKANLVEILRTHCEEDKKPAFVSSEPPTVVTPAPKDCVSFNSHCARESVERRLNESGPSQLIVKEIKVQLTIMGVKTPSKALKANLVEILRTHREEDKKPAFVSPEDAAQEKARAGESLAVEHIAELAPGQARKARTRVLFPDAVEFASKKKFTKRAVGSKEPASTRLKRNKKN